MEYDSRYIALMVLLENSKTKRSLDRTLEQFAPELDRLSKRDRALANAIIYGTLRWQQNLDWIIKDFSTRQIKELEPEALYLLRIALFQIVFMERIPTSAAVNTAVDIAKKASHKGVVSFVNAVLRKASSQYLNVEFPDYKKDPELFLAVKHSIPIWLVRRWIKSFSMEKTILVCKTINTIPSITIRTNTLKINRDELISLLGEDTQNISKTLYSDCGISFVKPKIAVHEIEAFKKGFFQVQDEAAQLVTYMLNPKPGERILDACAGRGGKTGHAGQLMENQGSIIAGDTDLQKLIILEEEMERLSINIVSSMQMDLLKTKLEDFKEPFDKILIDAPCSGLGVLKRNPDAKWKRTKKDVARLANKQQKMLLNAANLVKPGGTIVYAVCSCEQRENEDVMDFFLEHRKDFSINTDWLTGNIKIKDTIISKRGFLRTYPDILAMDGFFAVSMKRNLV